MPDGAPLPTTSADVGTADQDVGAFEGAKYAVIKSISPVDRGRMLSNTPLNSPIGMEEIRKKASNYKLDNMRKHVTLDADGDGKTDLLTIDRYQYGLFLSAERDTGVDDPITGSEPNHRTVSWSQFGLGMTGFHQEVIIGRCGHLTSLFQVTLRAMEEMI